MDPELIFTADAEAFGTDRRSLALRCRAGQLVRLRPGVYAQADQWRNLSPWEQQRLRVRAAAEQGDGQRILIQESAAVMWGLPVIGNSRGVLLLSVPPRHGHNRGELRWAERALLEPVTTLDGVPLTSRAQTVIDMAAYLPFEQAVPAMDRVLRPDPARFALTKDELRGLARALPAAGKQAKAQRVIDFADARSESAGESYSRAVLHRQGFPVPELQHEFHTSAGRFRTDFYWKEHGLVGEFDGAVKYGAAGSALAPSWDTLMREKRREDAIRETGAAVIRWSWRDVGRPPQHPESMAWRLARAGLPQSRRRH
ncbi:type IV toxin-antitoxin system AbiEi family antitoxin domain-containing protein [Arthrobacter sp. zg-Y20]|uniref:type IV toxin-antitoxin system AbiEi family antitoxin domain-containing protein n=1 Tax=unclassified Arthrobacter TaxID=235627 RepID=UPI001D13590F|nr:MULTISPECIES: type IV toxin-antitoxin system AbiEi family antitoxin domain-containing protein [unclassified Arthrobacter]MCC3277007.1 type IV toxin-antitoxin system AbiEi family antitoxin domain-containing protein [Arthrobacter sp. zg-Y20]MDK1317168.1 type IV toxin-antitoxin system AbiEi family antitoxin domain-containing protein [Arthrobacter sp. zg.Y20]MDK1328966.1 type IV toxin-antitoxin system AbiEi family antitoxin domain-containing protein [Arthrobacter sp. zg-Y1143]WIB07266.1 type IV 